MFPMLVKSTSRGRSYEYVHLCESVWKHGRSSRRTVVSLGRKDLLAQHLDRIFELCRGHKPASPADAVPLNSFRIGPFLALRRLWHEFGLPERLGNLSDRVLVLVANRLTAPASEHALADWLRTYFACDSQGRRFAPAYLSDAQRQAAQNPRVKVQAFQLQKWYRTLDALLPLKAALEEHLFGRFRHLFAPHCELVFYDLTSTYFEGLGPEELAQHGYSRDQRPRNPQLLVGVAMVDGLPVSHTVFAGNRRDSTTVREVLADLRKRFGLGRFVFVGDRGMKSEASVAALEEQGLGYLMAVQGRRNPEMAAALQAVREQAAGLIGEAAGKILSQNHGQRYYDWRLAGEERLEYWENESCVQEKRREGHWLLETEETALGAVEAVRAYQELWRVEAAFRSMKDVLELRPIWHRTDERVQAHVLVAALALTFDRILQRKLEKAGLRLSSRAAWAALEAVSLVEFEMPGQPRKAGICVNGEEGGHGNEARKVLRALGVALEAPQPPQNGDRIVH